MAAQHVHEIDAAIKELISSRRQEILQIAQNGANPGPLKNLVEIQAAIDALYRAREQEGRQHNQCSAVIGSIPQFRTHHFLTPR
jgi:hypothetical protein